MRRSKEIITQAIRLIILISIILFFLQSNICKTIRSAFSTYIFSFHGKCETISNIFIGILSSGILLIFSEIIKYFQDKRRIEIEILKLYHKWETELSIIDGIGMEIDGYIKYIPMEVIDFGELVEKVYNEYSPYIKKGKYFELIGALFRYTDRIQEYVGKIRYKENAIKYLQKCKEQLKVLKMRNTDEMSCKQLKSDIKWCEKKILELEEEDLDIEYMERKIDEARNEVVNNNEVAKSLFFEYKFKCLNKREKEDEEDKRRRQVKLAENEARRKAKQMYMEHIRDKD